ncbi:MAG: sugar-binding domain-containing protein [Christensenellales bacterium]
MNKAVHYEDALMIKAAWYYYFENMTQQAIADRLSISRMRVIKLLDAARQNGVIQFRLRSDSVGMMEQSRELMQKYRLKDVFIIPEAEQESQLNESIARAGAMYVADRLSENACINVGYGDTLSRTLNHLATMVQTPSPHPLTGGVSISRPTAGATSSTRGSSHARAAARLLARDGGGDAREASASEIIRMAAPPSRWWAWRDARNGTIVRSGIITQNELFRLDVRRGRRRALPLRR